MNDLLNKDIIEFDPTVRTYNCLKRAGIDTVGDIMKKTRPELLRIRNMGLKCIEEVEGLLKDVGLELRR